MNCLSLQPILNVIHNNLLKQVSKANLLKNPTECSKMQKSVHCSGCEVVKKVDSVIFTMEVEKDINNDIKDKTSI